MAAGERELINLLKGKLEKPANLVSQFMGEDCEVLDLGDPKRFLLVTIDTSSEKVDFPSNAPPFLSGYFSASLSLSDIAACGGDPIGILASCSISGNYANEMEAVYDGISQAANDVGTFVLGGDTNSADEFSLSVVSLGWVQKERLLQRRTAQVGDVVGVTGKFLDRFNANHFAYGKPDFNIDYENMLRQTAQVHAGKLLASAEGVTSCIDLPDGLIKALEDNIPGQLGFLIDDESIPIQFARNTENGQSIPNHVLSSQPAGDLELLFTVSKNALVGVESIFHEGGIQYHWIGEVVSDAGTRIKMKDGTVIAPIVGGFSHQFDGSKLFK